MPDNAWDVSADKSGKVMAWAVQKDGGYDLYIGGEGGVAANTKCNDLFNGYINATQILMNGNFHTENTTNMRAMFADCYSMTSVDLSDFNTSKVTDMRSMFSDCDSLKSVDLSSFDTSNVTTMKWMFYGSGSLERVDLSGFDTSKVTEAGAMFYVCYGLIEVDVSSFSSELIDTMYIPDGVSVIR